jgi:uncharacterized glyoxalase superfamily protein PhnB
MARAGGARSFVELRRGVKVSYFVKVVPCLRMFDEEKAREFYVDFLGFTVDWEHRYSPDLPLYLQLSLGGAVVHLSQHYGDASPGAKVMVHMGGLAGYHARLSAKQYRFARPGLVDEPWGAVTMTVHDPFSNRLVFTEFR